MTKMMAHASDCERLKGRGLCGCYQRACDALGFKQVDGYYTHDQAEKILAYWRTAKVAASSSAHEPMVMTAAGAYGSSTAEQLRAETEAMSRRADALIASARAACGVSETPMVAVATVSRPASPGAIRALTAREEQAIERIASGTLSAEEVIRENEALSEIAALEREVLNPVDPARDARVAASQRRQTIQLHAQLTGMTFDEAAKLVDEEMAVRQ